ncbi:MAG: N-acetylmuramoyl-L-alanine amidase [Bacteroidales bacterium]|nr:N-acetylmuramoyl-L-alanine amidase [Bacteroidales bacterium]
MEILEHRLFDESLTIHHSLTQCLSNPPQFRSTNYPDAIIIHYTAMSSAEGAVRALSRYKKSGGNASAHLVIARNGEIFQLAPFNYKTWHAGESSYNGRSSYNSFSVGIEIDNLGWLDEYTKDGKTYYSRKELDIQVAPEDVFTGKHRNSKVRKQFWHAYTDKQKAIVTEICKTLASNYGIKEILGHEEIAPKRKTDPGPAFPLEQLREDVLEKEGSGRSVEDDEVFTAYEGEVMATKLNIRMGPGTTDPKVAQPLRQGVKVTVMDKAGPWLKVRTEIEGWVHGDYIEKL